MAKTKLYVYYIKTLKKSADIISIDVFILNDSSIEPVGSFDYDTTSSVSEQYGIEKYLKKLGYVNGKGDIELIIEEIS